MRYYSKIIAATQSYSLSKEARLSRSIQFAKLSMLFNAVLAVSKIGMGIYSLSVFLCVGGLYNVGIGAAKALVVKAYDPVNGSVGIASEETSSKRQFHSYRLVGGVILLTSILYMAYCAKMLAGRHSNMQYTSIVAIAIAAFTFFEIGMAIRGVVVSKRENAPIMEAMKLTNLISSLISLVLTQAALMSFTYNGDASFYCGLSGILFGSISAITGVYMIIRSKRIVRGELSLSLPKT